MCLKCLNLHCQHASRFKDIMCARRASASTIKKYSLKTEVIQQYFHLIKKPDYECRSACINRHKALASSPLTSWLISRHHPKDVLNQLPAPKRSNRRKTIPQLHYFVKSMKIFTAKQSRTTQLYFCVKWKCICCLRTQANNFLQKHYLKTKRFILPNAVPKPFNRHW